MATLFVSDIHLDPARPAHVRGFLDFLSGEAARADALYILGDLFEAWIGDDDESELADAVAQALAALGARGVPCRFMHGNRDFLLGESYAGRAGLELLPQSQVVDLHGVPTLLLHGDTLCTGDLPYQRFREEVRDPEWQRRFLQQPLAERRAFANAARRESERHTAGAPMQIMDVAQDEVERVLRAAGVDRMIHGHTHRAGKHAFALDGRYAERVVTGDWYDRGSVLRASASGLELASL